MTDIYIEKQGGKDEDEENDLREKFCGELCEDLMEIYNFEVAIMRNEFYLTVFNELLQEDSSDARDRRAKCLIHTFELLEVGRDEKKFGISLKNKQISGNYPWPSIRCRCKQREGFCPL